MLLRACRVANTAVGQAKPVASSNQVGASCGKAYSVYFYCKNWLRHKQTRVFENTLLRNGDELRSMSIRQLWYYWCTGELVSAATVQQPIRCPGRNKFVGIQKCIRTSVGLASPSFAIAGVGQCFILRGRCWRLIHLQFSLRCRNNCWITLNRRTPVILRSVQTTAWQVVCPFRQNLFGSAVFGIDYT